MHYRSFAEGYSTTDVKQMGSRYVFSSDMLYNHRLKQIGAIAPSLIRQMDGLFQRKGDEIKKIYENVMDEDILSGKEDPELSRKIEVLFDSDEDFKKESEKLKSTFENMEKLKKSGFYVDIKHGKVRTPEDLTEREYRDVSRIFQELISSYAESVLGVIQPRREQLHRKVMDTLAQKQVRPAFGRRNKRQSRIGDGKT